MALGDVLKRQITRLYLTAFDEPLPPPTPSESRLASELRNAVRDCVPTQRPEGEATPSEAYWLENENRLRELVTTGDPRAFLRWDVIKRNMFVTFAPYVVRELSFLRKRPDWSTRWRDAIRESPVGHPVRYPFDRRTSSNLIHDAYSLAQFEEKTELSVKDLDLVLEFGGGYGSLCRLFHRLGFGGRYVLFDLPLFSALQRFYLASLGVSLHSVGSFACADSGVVCVSSMEELGAVLPGDLGERRSAFVANWSLSETPLTVRDALLPFASRCRAFLIAYSHGFREVDNVDYFGRWRRACEGAILWQEWPIQHLRGSSYLVGVRAER